MLLFCVCLGLIFLCFYVSLGQLIPVLLAFSVLGLVCSVVSQETGWEERLRNDQSILCRIIHQLYFTKTGRDKKTIKQIKKNLTRKT